MSHLPSSALAEAVLRIPFAWLRDRRWFSSKGRRLDSLAVIDWGALRLPDPAIAALVRASYADGFEETLFLPLVALPHSQIPGARPPAAVEIELDGSAWHAHDAFQHESFQRLLMTHLISGEPLPLTHGHIMFAPEALLRDSPPPLREIRLVTAEQSNSSIIYDRQAILKCFRRVVAGVNPDVEIAGFLTHAGFQHTPAMLGSMSYTRDGVEHSLGILQEFVPNQGDAWDHTLQRLGVYFESIPAAPPDDGPEATQLANESLVEIRELGRLTGELHRALASNTDDPSFAPRPLTHYQIAAWQRSIRESANEIFGALESRLHDLPREQRDSVGALLKARERIDRRIDQLASLADAGVVVTRFHGDYHLGQVLVSERGWLILDFEGEPLRSLDERRAHGSPLKDVAGMLRSLSYAAESGLRSARRSGLDLARWAAAWETEARGAFLDGYSEVTQGAPFVPQTPEVFNDALTVFELEKALYELKYELNNRPDWLPIPLAGIERTL